tara:strand:- start:1112 stop:1327 length:216 start_codon:yes stop_codon:yes gene_type:complete
MSEEKLKKAGENLALSLAQLADLTDRRLPHLINNSELSNPKKINIFRRLLEICLMDIEEIETLSNSKGEAQ